MEIEYDEAKRRLTLQKRGLDFADAARVLEGEYIVQDDDRVDYPEPRYQTYGYLGERLVMFAWTPIDDGMRIISMRKCNERERQKYERWLGR